MKKKPSKEPRKLISFDAPEDVRRMLEKAMQATGADRTELIVEALRTDLLKVVQRLVEERRKAEAEFFRMAKVEPGCTDNSCDPPQPKRKLAS